MRRLKKIFEEFDANDNIDVLRDILDQIIELMDEANEIVRAESNNTDPIIYERWKAYPYNNIMAMLSSGTKYDTMFIDIIDDLEQAANQSDDF